MNTRLFILGIDILVISAFIITYGLTTSSVELVGVGASISIIGGVVVAYSTVPREPTLEAVLSYTTLLAHATTSVIEDLDLLNHRLCVYSSAGSTLIVFSKKDCPSNPNPGIGFTGGLPYYSIPVDLFQHVERLEELTTRPLEEFLNFTLVDELGLCRSIRVEQKGEFIVIDVVGLAKSLVEFTKYPVDPVVLLVPALVARLAGECKVHLIEKDITPGYIRLVIRVEKLV